MPGQANSLFWSISDNGPMTLPSQETIPLLGGGAIPLVGFGTWRLTGRSSYEAVRHALATGYRHIDTATMYGNEAEVGQAIRDSGLSREEVFLTTKLLQDDADHPDQAIDASLRRLGMDYVDLWLIHWPPGGQASPKTWEKVLAQRELGKARSAGVSNYSTDQVDELIAATGDTPTVNQVRWGPAFTTRPSPPIVPNAGSSSRVTAPYGRHLSTTLA